MKILLTTDTWTPAVNGVVRSVELLYRELLALGHDVRVLTLSGSSRSCQEGRVTYLGSLSAEKVYPGVRLGLRILSHWLGELEEWKPDVIHSQSEFSTFIPACQLAKSCDCPLVHTYHTMWEDYTHYICPSERLGKAAAEYFTRVVAGRCYAILAPTGKIRALLESYGVECSVFTVPTGIDLGAFQPLQDGGAARAELRAQLGIPADAPVMLSLGRLAAEKNHAKLLQLLAAWPEAARPWLVFVGDGPARADLEAEAARLDLTRQVRFAGMVKPEEVPRWYQVGDVFVSASQSETQGLTYFEALACGLPAICRADPCLDGVVENGINGWQWEEDATFRQGFEDVMANHADYAAKALETAARYSSQNFARQALEVYQQAIDAPRPKKDRVLPDVAKAMGELVEYLSQ